MNFKKQLMTRFIILAILVLVYAGSLLYDFFQLRSQSELFSLLHPDDAERSTLLYISDAKGVERLLLRENNNWYLLRNEQLLPANESRIHALLSLLSTPSTFIPSATTEEAAERLSLTENQAARITLLGRRDAAPLLDLLIGVPDRSSQQRYIRRAESNRIYTAVDAYTAYIYASQASWLALRLFPAATDLDRTYDAVQRIQIEYRGAEDFTLQRVAGQQWIMEEYRDVLLDVSFIRSYILGILNLNADDFSDIPPDAVHDMRIAIEFGNLDRVHLYLHYLEDQGGYLLRSSESEFSYFLQERNAERLIQSRSLFILD